MSIVSLGVEDIPYQTVSFTGTGCKDVTENMVEHSAEDLVQLIGTDGARARDGELVLEPFEEPCA